MNPATLILAALIAAAPLAASAADNFLDRARNAVQEAGKDVQAAAKKAGRSVRDFLTDHPELNRDVVDFGDQVGVPGFAGAKPAVGPLVALSVPQGRTGDEVTVTATGLPGDQAVTVEAGSSPAEVRRLADGRTSDRGELIATVNVPPKPDDGDKLVFVVETTDGRLRVASEPFLVVPPGAAVVVTGTLSAEGTECPTLRGDDGKLYSLTGAKLGKLGPGNHVHVEGTLADVSTCMQGTTIVVSSIAAAK
jgi:Protein of unknown function (DUF5818)